VLKETKGKSCKLETGQGRIDRMEKGWGRGKFVMRKEDTHANTLKKKKKKKQKKKKKKKKRHSVVEIMNDNAT